MPNNDRLNVPSWLRFSRKVKPRRLMTLTNCSNFRTMLNHERGERLQAAFRRRVSSDASEIVTRRDASPTVDASGFFG